MSAHNSASVAYLADIVRVLVRDYGADTVLDEVKHARVQGTVAGSRRHRRRQEPPCDPCREAWNAYYRVPHATPAKPREADHG
jgi:hypothetical protein